MHADQESIVSLRAQLATANAALESSYRELRHMMDLNASCWSQVQSILPVPALDDERSLLKRTVDEIESLRSDRAKANAAVERMCARVERGEHSEDCPFCMAKKQTPGIPNPMCHLCELESSRESHQSVAPSERAVKAEAEVARLNDVITGLFPETAALHEILRRAGCVSVSQADYDELQRLRVSSPPSSGASEAVRKSLRNIACEALGLAAHAHICGPKIDDEDIGEIADFLEEHLRSFGLGVSEDTARLDWLAVKFAAIWQWTALCRDAKAGQPLRAAIDAARGNGDSKLGLDGSA